MDAIADLNRADIGVPISSDISDRVLLSVPSLNEIVEKGIGPSQCPDLLFNGFPFRPGVHGCLRLGPRPFDSTQELPPRLLVHGELSNADGSHFAICLVGEPEFLESRP
jgi:hypothetical protein